VGNWKTRRTRRSLPYLCVFLRVSVPLRGKISIYFNSSYNRTVREDHHVAKDRSPKKEVKKPKKKK